MITEEDFIDFKCPYCGDPISFPKQQAGTAQQCPMCFESVILPTAQGEPGRKIPLPLSTERLILRRLQGGDWKDLLEILGDEDPTRLDAPDPVDEDSILKWLEADAHVRLTTPDQTFFIGIVQQAAGKLIGFIALRRSGPEGQTANLSVTLNRAFEKQGFAIEAMDALLSLCFEQLRFHRIAISCDSRNSSALQLFGRVGLRREGEFIKDRLVRGEWANTVHYAALREEYEQS